MLKNAYLLGKNCKNRLSIEGLAPEPPFASGGSALRHLHCNSRLQLQLCRVRF